MGQIAATAFFSQSGPWDQETVDHRIVLYNVDWDSYVALNDAIGEEHPSVRVSYLEGILEVMTTSPRHEMIKKHFARLLEAFADEKGIEIIGFGQTTYRKRAKQRGFEGDEAYCVGTPKKRPDFLFEVIITHGSINRLELFAGMQIPEVCFYKEGRLYYFRLGNRGYQATRKSLFFPGLDLALLERLLRIPSQSSAVRELRGALRR